MSIKDRILFKLYGAKYMEAYKLDSMLEIFSDEKVRDLSLLTTNKPIESDRIITKLINDGFLDISGSYHKITSEGLLFYGQGGYTHQFLVSKRSNWSFVISVISVIIAIASFVISISR